MVGGVIPAVAGSEMLEVGGWSAGGVYLTVVAD